MKMILIITLSLATTLVVCIIANITIRVQTRKTEEPSCIFDSKGAEWRRKMGLGPLTTLTFDHTRKHKYEMANRFQVKHLSR